MSRPFQRNERPRDDSNAIAKFNALFKSKAEIESETEKAEREAERVARRAARQQARERVLAIVASNEFTYEEIFAAADGA